MLRIIDHKRIELTDAEFALYQEICRSYDRPNFKGEELFKHLFETNEKGIIIFLRPPQDKVPFSFEVYMFLMNIMVHQHLGAACEHIDFQIAEMKKVNDEAKRLIKDMESLRAALEVK